MKIQILENKNHPKVIHANGKSSHRDGDLYRKIETQFLESQIPQKDKTDDLLILTWKGGKYENQEVILERCMRLYDHPIKILPWPVGVNFWEGSKFKIDGTLEYLRDVKSKYFMWFDAGDVILIDSPSSILESYKEKFSGKLVFNAERNHYPKENRQTEWSDSLKKQYKDLELIDNKHESSFRYMNTGACVGETSIVIEFLEKCQKWMGEKINDTVAGRLAQQEMSDKVVVDRNCELMVCLYDVNESELLGYE